MIRLSCFVLVFVFLQAFLLLFSSMLHEKVLYNRNFSPKATEDEFLNQKGYEGEVAVCISGQVARWQPHHLVKGLLKANPQFRFYLFFNIQAHKNHSEIVYNTDPENVFQQSDMTGLNYEQSWQILTEMNNLANSRVISLLYIAAANADEWKQALNTTKLDRITQYLHAQTTILNMYAHHPHCIEQILAYEKTRNTQIKNNYLTPFHFDYIASTREDVYFFKPMNLSPIASIITPNKNHSCDIPFKRCLNFWGFNMRFYLLRRDVGVRFLGNRLSFYRFMFDVNRTVENPERFELNLAVALQLSPCPMSVEDYPVTAARQSSQREGVCFIWFEVDRCVPKDSQQFVKQHFCAELRRKTILQKRYGNSRWEKEYRRIFRHSFGCAPLLLDERYRSLRPSQYTLQVASHLSAHHSDNASRNLELMRSQSYVERRYPTLSHVCKDVTFMRKTWRPDYE